MKFSLIDIITICGCYGLAAFLLFHTAPPDGRPAMFGGRLPPPGEQMRGIVLKVAGLAATWGTACLMTYGSYSGPWMWILTLYPIVLAVLAWRKRSNRTRWMNQLAGTTGRVLIRPDRPSFGVLSDRGKAVRHDDINGALDLGVECEINAHRLIGMQYRIGLCASSPPANTLTKVEQYGQATTLVQLACPRLPALVITPRGRILDKSLLASIGDDQRIAVNALGMLQPDAVTHPVHEGWEPAFTARFEVRAENESFARAVLTPDVQRMLVGDPWFHVRGVTCHQGVIWSGGRGALTRWIMETSVDRLTQLAAAIPAQTWRAFTPAHEAEPFLARIRSNQMVSRPRLRRSLVAIINDRRTAANRTPLSPRSLLLRLLIILTLITLSVAIITTSSPFWTDGPIIGAFIALQAFGVAAALTKANFFPRPGPGRLQRWLNEPPAAKRSDQL